MPVDISAHSSPSPPTTLRATPGNQKKLNEHLPPKGLALSQGAEAEPADIALQCPCLTSATSMCMMGLTGMIGMDLPSGKATARKQLAMAMDWHLPRDLHITLLDVHGRLPLALLPSPDPRNLVPATMDSTLASSNLTYGAPLAPALYIQLRELLEASRLNRATQLVIILLLHYGHHPDDTLAHRAILAFYIHAQRAQDQLIETLFADKNLDPRYWTPATGPPWPQAHLAPQPWMIPINQSAQLALLKAGCGSPAPLRPYSGDPRALAGANLLASALESLQTSPPIQRIAARTSYQIWISYPDLLLRGLRSPSELDEGRCVTMLHCLICASATMGYDNMYSLADELLRTGFCLIKRTLPVVLDAIALHPDWFIFPHTAALAFEVEWWLGRNSKAVDRPAATPGELERYPLVRHQRAGRALALQQDRSDLAPQRAPPPAYREADEAWG